MKWYFEVDPTTNEYLHQSDKAFSLRCQARENTIYKAAEKLGISREQLLNDNYISTLNEDAFEDIGNAEKYLRERYEC